MSQIDEVTKQRVVIAGAGVAGLEALFGLHALAKDRVSVTLVAPQHDFVYRPVRTQRPFEVGRVRSVALSRAAEDADATFVPGRIEEVDTDGRRVVMSTGEGLSYDALILTVGAEAKPALDSVMTWDDQLDSEIVGGLLRDFEEGYAERLAVVIPPGPGYPLRGYELALLVNLHAYDMSADIETTIVTPQPPPLAMLGDHLVEAVASELDRAGIAEVSAQRVDITRGRHVTLVLGPSGQRLEVDRVLAMPRLRGRPIRGVSVNEYGLIEVDEHCRVAALERVWAAGDCTAFPVKSGAFSTAQADVAAEDVAAMTGAAVKHRTLDPLRSEQLAGLPSGRFLEARLSASHPGLSMHLPILAVPVLTYLQKDLAAAWRSCG